MIRCGRCEYLNFYPPSNSYINTDEPRCYMAGGLKVDITRDRKEELENKNLQHVCVFQEKKKPVQLELNFG